MPTVNENVEQWNFHKILPGENIFVIMIKLFCISFEGKKLEKSEQKSVNKIEKFQ
mgnify:CR=1 FL=1